MLIWLITVPHLLDFLYFSLQRCCATAWRQPQRQQQAFGARRYACVEIDVWWNEINCLSSCVHYRVQSLRSSFSCRAFACPNISSHYHVQLELMRNWWAQINNQLSIQRCLISQITCSLKNTIKFLTKICPIICPFVYSVLVWLVYYSYWVSSLLCFFKRTEYIDQRSSKSKCS